MGDGAMIDIRSRVSDALRKAMFCDSKGVYVGDPVKLTDALLALSDIAVVDTTETMTLEVRDGQWKLTYSNGRTSSAPIDTPAAVLTAHFIDGDHVTVMTRVRPKDAR